MTPTFLVNEILKLCTIWWEGNKGIYQISRFLLITFLSLFEWIVDRKWKWHFPLSFSHCFKFIGVTKMKNSEYLLDPWIHKYYKLLGRKQRYFPTTALIMCHILLFFGLLGCYHLNRIETQFKMAQTQLLTLPLQKAPFGKILKDIIAPCSLVKQINLSCVLCFNYNKLAYSKAKQPCSNDWEMQF